MTASPHEAVRNEAHRKARFACILSLLCIVPLGLATKLYDGPGSGWMRASLGGFFYELFWCLLTAVFLPRIRSARIAAAVFLITCTLEFLQLWHPPFLEVVRATMMGRALIGDVFDWGDFPYYAMGCVTGWAWLEVIRRSSFTGHPVCRHDANLM